MRRLTYDASPRHRLKLGEEYVQGGQEFEAADDLAERLLASEVPVIEHALADEAPTPTTTPDVESDEGSTHTEESQHG